MTIIRNITVLTNRKKQKTILRVELPEFNATLDLEMTNDEAAKMIGLIQKSMADIEAGEGLHS